MASEHFDVWLENAIEGVSVQAEDISIPQFRIYLQGARMWRDDPCRRAANKEIAGNEKETLKKIQVEPVRLRDRLDAMTIWATKPHAESQANVSWFLFLVNESDHN